MVWLLGLVFWFFRSWGRRFIRGGRRVGAWKALSDLFDLAVFYGTIVLILLAINWLEPRLLEVLGGVTIALLALFVVVFHRLPRFSLFKKQSKKK